MDRLDVIEQILLTQHELLVFMVGYGGLFSSEMPPDLLERLRTMEILIEEIRKRGQT